MLLFYPQALVLDCLIHWAGVIDELYSLYVSNVIILSPGLGSGLSYTLGLGSLMSLILYMSLKLLFYPQALVLDCLIHWAGVIDEMSLMLLFLGLGSGVLYTGPGSYSLILLMSLMLLFYPQALVLDCLIHWAGVIDELNTSICL